MGANVACDTDANCPQGSQCKLNIQRCVSTRNTDNVAPDFASLPSVTWSGRLYTVKFDVNEALARPPEVVAKAGALTFTFVADGTATDSDHLHYAFFYAAMGSEPEAEALVTVDLVDRVGNAASRVAGSFTFDFTPPAMSDFNWVLAAGQSATPPSATLTFHGLTDDQALLRGARLIDPDGQTLADISATTTLDATGVLGSAEVVGSVDLGGVDLSKTVEVAVELDLQDAAGNQTPPELARTPFLVVDSDPPLDPSVLIQGQPVVGTQSVTLTLAAIGATQMLIEGDIVHDTSTFQWVDFTTTLPVTLTQGDGYKTVTASFRDAALNATGPVSDTIYLATGSVVSQPSLVLPTGQTALKNGDTLTVAGLGEPNATVVSARLVDIGTDATAQLVDTGAIAVDVDGNMSGSFVSSGLADGTNVALEVVLFGRGMSSVAANSRSQAVAVDLLPPPAPDPIKLQLVEEAGPETVPPAESNNTFSLTGAGGAVVSGTLVRIYADPSATFQLAEVAVAPADGSFTASAITYSPLETYYVVALDGAGNKSSPTLISVPQFSLVVTPDPAREGTQENGKPADIALTSNVSLAATPSVTVAAASSTARAASFVSQSGTTYHFSFTPTAGDPTAPTPLVIRVTGSDGSGSFAAGTSGTDAFTTLLDFTAPTLNAAVTLTEGDPLTDDSVSAPAGAASDDVSTASAIRVRLVDADSSATIATTSANSDGSIGPLSIGDNLHTHVVVKLLDEAGNASAPSATLTNDRAPPLLSSVALDHNAQHAGASIVVSFSVSDDHSDLRAADVSILGRNAVASMTNDLGTSDGLVHDLAFIFDIQAGDAEGLHDVSITCTDNAGNVASATTTLLVDSTDPTSTNTTPGSSSSWNGSPGVLGTSDDNLSGVLRIDVGVEQAGSWWDGSAFVSTETYLPATGTSNWFFDDSAVPYAAGSYTLHWHAIDVAGNVETDHTWGFTYTSTAPAEPTALAAQSLGEAHIDLTWTPPLVHDAYLLYYSATDAPGPPYAGTGAAEGDSPIALAGADTTATLTELPPGRYEIVLTALDASGNESPYSNEATAPSRWWRWKEPATTSVPVTALVSPSAGVFIAFGGSGAMWRSTDAGMGWVPQPLDFDWSAIPSRRNYTFVNAVALGTDILAGVDPDHLVLSHDSGATWEIVTVPSPNDLRLAVAMTSSHMVAVGSDERNVNDWGTGAFYSTDGGTTWKASTGIGSYQPYDVVADGDVDLAVGSGGLILRSSDKGATWATMTSNTSRDLFKVWLAGLDAVAVGSNIILYSSDGGVSWNPALSASEDFTALYGSGNNLIAAGTNIFYSTDGGAQWNTTTAASFSAITSVWGNGTSFYAVNGYYLFETANLVDWTQSSLPGFAAALLWGSGGDVVAADGYGRFAVRPEATATWQLLPNAWSQANRAIVARGSEAWILGANSTGFRLMHTTDEGETFDILPDNPSALGGVKPVYLVESDGMLLAGSNASFATSVDGGHTWSTYSSVSPGSNLYAWAAFGNDFVAVGEAGVVVHAVRQVDDTMTITLPTRVTTQTLRAIVGHANPLDSSTTTFVAVGDGGAIVRSTDGGAMWSTPSSGTGAALSHINVNGSTFIVVGASGTVTRSADDGANWTAKYIGGPYEYFHAIWNNGSYAVAVGNCVFYDSVDDGQTWSAGISSTDPRYTFFDDVAGAGATIVAAADEAILESFDGGATWQRAVHFKPWPHSEALTHVHVFADGTVLFASFNGDVIRFGP